MSLELQEGNQEAGISSLYMDGIPFRLQEAAAISIATVINCHQFQRVLASHVKIVICTLHLQTLPWEKPKTYPCMRNEMQPPNW